jgi:hypothetical protein
MPFHMAAHMPCRGAAPANEAEQAKLIDTLQDWKTNKYQEMIGWVGGLWAVKPRDCAHALILLGCMLDAHKELQRLLMQPLMMETMRMMSILILLLLLLQER